jgi:hypothetical protein
VDDVITANVVEDNSGPGIRALGTRDDSQGGA